MRISARKKASGKNQLKWAIIPFFRYLKTLGEAGKQEIDIFRKLTLGAPDNSRSRLAARVINGGNIIRNRRNTIGDVKDI